jgi:hypothetical protein
MLDEGDAARDAVRGDHVEDIGLVRRSAISQASQPTISRVARTISGGAPPGRGG